MNPSARRRITDALRNADLPLNALGTGHLRVVIEQVVEQAYEDGVRETKGLKDE